MAREEFMQSIDARGKKIDASNIFIAARVESDRIKNNERKLEGLQKENTEAKNYLRSGKDLSHPDAVHAAMFASATLRRDIEKTENDIKESEEFIKGDR